MEDELTRDEFLDMLCIKNQLINAPTEQLLEEYKDKNQYKNFVQGMNLLVEKEPAFLYLSDKFYDKAISVMSLYRFQIVKENKEYYDAINNIITMLNNIKTQPEIQKELIKTNYLAYHEEVRDLYFDDEPDFLRSLARDAIVYLCLEKQDVSEINSVDFYGSTKYFQETCPVIYQDEQINTLTRNKLEEMAEQEEHHFLSRSKKRFKTLLKELPNKQKGE